MKRIESIHGSLMPRVLVGGVVGVCCEGCCIVGGM